MRNIQGGEFKSNDEILRSVYLHLTYRIKHGIGEKNLQIIYVIRNFLLKFFKEHLQLKKNTYKSKRFEHLSKVDKNIPVNA